MLLRIAGNIVDHPDDPAFRSIKASSKKLKSDVLDISGGRDALVQVRATGPSPASSRAACSRRANLSALAFRQLGFRTKTVAFEQHWVFDPALASPSTLGAQKGGHITYLELLKLGYACLRAKDTIIKERCGLVASASRAGREADRLLIDTSRADKGRANVRSNKEEQAEIRSRTLAAVCPFAPLLLIIDLHC
jgi:hypothetical protein